MQMAQLRLSVYVELLYNFPNTFNIIKSLVVSEDWCGERVSDYEERAMSNVRVSCIEVRNL